MADICICCGERAAEFRTQTARHCYECNRLVGNEPDMSDAWPLLFARSMARMARRAEVEGLVMEITGHAVEMSSGLPWYRLNHVGRAHRDKLLRLAALALEGHGDG